jgi:diaminohydroxyphosphoribosylaminopyrimidine deaminase/5-amino-6-(5-phosphoribosylamino)uracil reductase
VTLEPCHRVGDSGRAEACATSLIAARIGRVVVATLDPNPHMSGAAIETLRVAGIEVDVGILEDEAKERIRGFASRMTRGRPWVRVKMAASLDGRTALADGTSQWITGPAARADGHAWRARACAVMTGIGTVLHDDPALNVRAVETARQPRRIVVDRHGTSPPGARIFAGTDAVWMFSAMPPSTRFPSHVETIVLADASGRVDLTAMMMELGRRRVNELHVEGGAKLAGALLAHGLVDELLLYYAPCLLGDDARGMFGLPALDSLDARIPLDVRDVRRIGDDWRIVAVVSPASALRVGHPEAGSVS